MLVNVSLWYTVELILKRGISFCRHNFVCVILYLQLCVGMNEGKPMGNVLCWVHCGAVLSLWEPSQSNTIPLELPRAWATLTPSSIREEQHLPISPTPRLVWTRHSAKACLFLPHLARLASHGALAETVVGLSGPCSGLKMKVPWSLSKY